MYEVKYESRTETQSRLAKMTDEEIANELYCMKNLALWLYRNDEGTGINDEYRDFHQYLRLLIKEASKRGILKNIERYISIGL